SCAASARWPSTARYRRLSAGRRRGGASTSGSRLAVPSSDACTATRRNWSRGLASASTKTVAPSVHAGLPGSTGATSTSRPAIADASSLYRPSVSDPSAFTPRRSLGRRQPSRASPSTRTVDLTVVPSVRSPITSVNRCATSTHAELGRRTSAFSEPARMIEFTGQAVVVTGAGRGLGRLYAIELARRGAAVVVNDIGGTMHGEGSDPTVADRVVEEIERAGGVAVASHDSVAFPEGGAAIVRSAVDRFGRLDAVVSNAGIFQTMGFDELSPPDWHRMLSVHLDGGFHLSQPAFRVMKTQGYGRFVFI